MSKATERSRKYASLIALGLAPDEAVEVLESDDHIDKGEKLFELSDEQKKAEKKYKNCGTRTVKSPYGQTLQKEKKVDADKRFLMDILTETASEHCDKVNIVREEGEFEIFYNNRKFKIVLSCPRK